MELLRDVENEIAKIKPELSSHICDSELAELYQFLTKLKCDAVKCGSKKWSHNRNNMLQVNVIIEPWNRKNVFQKKKKTFIHFKLVKC